MQGDIDFTTTLKFRLLGNQMVKDEFYQLVKTCRYTAWASREIVCNSNYMEVSEGSTALWGRRACCRISGFIAHEGRCIFDVTA